nr:MAG TPA: hypothetical protein [Caudoviricetes sp.]
MTFGRDSYESLPLFLYFYSNIYYIIEIDLEWNFLLRVLKK